ncbi:MAG TPA: hypothetical protein VES02_17215 [Dermatophilaceae bacterium]|nr:hypothetical protein [Dermatophilaceae bacterium]
MKTSARTVVLSPVVLPITVVIGPSPPSHCARPLWRPTEKVATILLSQLATRVLMLSGVQVIRTARCRPAVVGTLIEAFDWFSIGTSSTICRFMPSKYAGKPPPPSLRERGPGPGPAAGSVRRWVEPVVATRPPTTSTAAVTALRAATRRRRAAPARRRAPATRASTSGYAT